MDALKVVRHQLQVDTLVAEIHGDFPEAADDAGDDEIRAAIAQATAAAPGLGLETWAAASLLAKVTFLLGEAPWEAPDLGALAAILNDHGYGTEADKLQAFVDGVAAHVDGTADAMPASSLAD